MVAEAKNSITTSEQATGLEEPSSNPLDVSVNKEGKIAERQSAVDFLNLTGLSHSYGRGRTQASREFGEAFAAGMNPADLPAIDSDENNDVSQVQAQLLAAGMAAGMKNVVPKTFDEGVKVNDPVTLKYAGQAVATIVDGDLLSWRANPTFMRKAA